ncbi:YagK/YfjJ domain-containing protein, partial [Pseudomonas aeruginosa]
STSNKQVRPWRPDLNEMASTKAGAIQGSERVNMISRIEESWASALGLLMSEVDGLVHIPENPTYRIDRHPRMRKVAWSEHKVLVDELPDLFHRASYLCKKATKSYGDRQRGFGTSRG